MAESSPPEPGPLLPEPSGWLNRSTVGGALASLFSDVSHELATAVLPMVLLSLGAGAASLGLIEGVADALSAAAKLWGGLQTDRRQRRKPLAALGYLATGLGTAAIGLCTQSWQILGCRVIAWVGRGSRSAARDVLISENASAAGQGRAFGLERAGDAFGAVLGPLLALGLMAHGVPAREVMRWSLLPGLLAFGAIAVLIVERPHALPRVPRSFRASVAGTGKPFHRFLGGIFVFGCGDFSRTLLILYATEHVTEPVAGGVLSLSRATLAICLYVLHNAVSALAAFPVGALADRLGRRKVIVVGYAFAAASTAAFALLPPTPALLAVLFLCSGLYIACQEVAEKACAVELLPKELKGTGLGVLATTNGLGDLVSSALVGALWAAFPPHPGVGFVVAASLQAAGAALIASSGGPSASAASETG